MERPCEARHVARLGEPGGVSPGWELLTRIGFLTTPRISLEYVLVCHLAAIFQIQSAPHLGAYRSVDLVAVRWLSKAVGLERLFPTALEGHRTYASTTSRLNQQTVTPPGSPFLLRS